MKLLEIWKRIGKQPLRITRRKDAIIFIGNSEYRIKNVRYNHGKFMGFEAEPYIQWFNASHKPKADEWVIVKDKNGIEYDNHQWNGMCWYAYCFTEDGCDGWRSDVDIVSWRYEED